MRSKDMDLVSAQFPDFDPFWDTEQQRSADEKVTGSVRLFLGLYRTREESEHYYNKLREIELP